MSDRATLVRLLREYREAQEEGERLHVENQILELFLAIREELEIEKDALRERARKAEKEKAGYHKALLAARHALLSYQYGNGSPDLTQETVAFIEKTLGTR